MVGGDTNHGSGIKMYNDFIQPFQGWYMVIIGYPGLDPGLFTFLALWAKENIYLAGYFICLVA